MRSRSAAGRVLPSGRVAIIRIGAGGFVAHAPHHIDDFLEVRLVLAVLGDDFLDEVILARRREGDCHGGWEHFLRAHTVANALSERAAAVSRVV